MNPRFARSPAGIVDVVVIGAGHSGLAMSRELGRRSIDHVVLERGEVANSWRRERWDSLRLLTPNWLCRLPGLAYDGDDPDGFMTVDEVVEFIDSYAEATAAPVVTGTSVTSLCWTDAGYRVETEQGDWRCRAVVAATGAFNLPVVPGAADQLPAGLRQISARDYRNPGQLDDGGVLVVGASATGLQLAEEIHASGRPVTLAVGEHVRMPRSYRGHDIQWWMLACGLLDQRIEDEPEPLRARRVPSPQLVGSPERRTLDLNALSAEGVRLVGRLAAVRDGVAQFSGSLRNTCLLADLKMNRLLGAIDEWADANGIDAGAGPAERFEPTRLDASPTLSLDLRGGEIRSVVWATGFRPDYSWLDLPVFDRRGRLMHDRGVAAFDGLYVLGLPYLRRRKSSFIHGAGDDVRELGAHLAGYLDRSAPRTAQG